MSKVVRAAAWQAISCEADDAACYPTAQLALFPLDTPNASLLVERTAEVRRAVGAALLRDDVCDEAERAAAAKKLLNALGNGGTVAAWCEERRASLRGDAFPLAAVRVGGGDGPLFDVLEYAAEAGRVAWWVASRRPRVVEHFAAANAAVGEGGKRAELTALSYLLQDYEGRSRDAKLEWARRVGARIVNLQHDGVQLRLPHGWCCARAEAGMTAAASSALGYRQVVTIKAPPGLGGAAWEPESLVPAWVPQARPIEFVAAPAQEVGCERSATLRRAVGAAVGEADPGDAVELMPAGADKLELDGRCRRAVYSYVKAPSVAARQWRETVSGGHHVQWRGRGECWLGWARRVYRVAPGGRLTGDPNHPEAPLAAALWRACSRALQGSSNKVDDEESQFALDQLLVIEANYPVTHLVASDGSRTEATDDTPTAVGRACIGVSHGQAGDVLLGGGLAVYADGFSQHSYEAELAAFHDHLAATEGTVTVFITDCLSGATAGQAFPRRTLAERAGRYRDKQLDNLARLEDRHRAVLYMHVRSHCGIQFNEAADVVAAQMRESPIAPLDLMPSRHALCRVSRVKRGLGRAVFDACSALALNKLHEATHFSLYPSKTTWALFRGSLARAKLTTEATFDALVDARANRAGLMADEDIDDPGGRAATAGVAVERRRRPCGGTWQWWCQRHCPCPGCCAKPSVAVPGHGSQPGAVRTQTRWHVLTACPQAELRELRRLAALWLGGKLDEFNTMQAHWAFAAVSGAAERLDAGQRLEALRFLLGAPDAPQPVDEAVCKKKLAAGYGRGFLRCIADMLRLAGRGAAKAREDTKINAVKTLAVARGEQVVVVMSPAPRRVWMASRGLREIWAHYVKVRAVFCALRAWAAVQAGCRMADGPQVDGPAASAPAHAPDLTPGGAGGGEDWLARGGKWKVAGDYAFDAWLAESRRLVSVLGLTAEAAGAVAEARRSRWRERLAACRKRMVWLRHQGRDPEAVRQRTEQLHRVAAARRARRQAADDARAAKAAARVARAEAKAAAAETARRERREAAAAAKRRKAEEAALATRAWAAAPRRAKRSSEGATMAAIDAARAVSQRTDDGGPELCPPCERPLPAAAESTWHRCGRGHLLVGEAVSADESGIVCDGPCGRVIRAGEMRHGCAGMSCDVDICGLCLGRAGAAAEAGEVPGADRPRCERGHGLRFRQVGVGAGRTVRCDGRCRGWLPERAWYFGCAAGCDFDVCVACVAELRRRGGEVRVRGERKRTLPRAEGFAVGQGGEEPAVRRRRARLRL